MSLRILCDSLAEFSAQQIARALTQGLDPGNRNPVASGVDSQASTPIRDSRLDVKNRHTIHRELSLIYDNYGAGVTCNQAG